MTEILLEREITNLIKMIFLIRLKFMFEDLFSLIRCHVI